MDIFEVSKGAAWAVLFSVLVVFTILAMGSTDMIPGLPDGAKALCLLNKKGDDAHTTDYFLSARNSASYLAIALSFFASGMGAWVVYGTTEMGANPELSWLGVLGYAGASALPAIIVCFLGPHIRERSKSAFSTTDFGRERYGRVMQLCIATISVFYMFIYIVAELTSISNVFALLANDNTKGFSIGVTVAIGFFTLLYTGFAGLPASIVTDKFQGIIMALLVLILTIAVCSFDENKVTKEEFALAANWTTEGLMAMITLFIAIACAEMFNQATWQRVWAAEDIPALRKGFGLGSLLVFLLMMFFGIMGMIAYANDPEAYDNFEKFAFLAFFDLLLPLGNGWHILVLIFVTALAASSIDSLQNGLTSIFYHDLVKVGWNPKLVTRILVILVNIPAIWLASKKFYVLELFLVADLVCATAVFPTFLGLQETDKLGGLLPAPTELGAFMGILSGMATVLINGAVNDAEGGLFQYFWLRNDGICALCGPKTMMSFILTPTIAGIMTYAFTHLDLAARGERARSPIFAFAFDEEEIEAEAPKNVEDGEEEQSAEKSEEEAENSGTQAEPEVVASVSEEEAA
mmetsp:Transcript_56420/g.85311  ORF Transcript_56420/g.85311 Transcript_56420/m.85311 type:complete len:577 (+) Transcript_56420:130-1860(+)|eukprot:CAMPEP_0117023934 /NCGR_PEP_ID=MMETSP0472-20121206/17819_1 /TAXON_ID=693140 ORGANISM="Tiarina fusus, Strain LIS" /NCGR_SAMPLE_ID=MMETSP0472 /ASSEMBLY_ACC=CAM_ASM_000603 /LENGTH=576 /DNA_ID=CAMNT_0004730209 /DNA_START=130 /DNA_END=1860 /DNA_ORIENTATION=+